MTQPSRQIDGPGHQPPVAPLAAVAGQKQVTPFITLEQRPAGSAFCRSAKACRLRVRFSRNGSVAAGRPAGTRRQSGWRRAVRREERAARIAKIGDGAGRRARGRRQRGSTDAGGPRRPQPRRAGLLRLQTGELLHEIRKHTDWVLRRLNSAPTASCWPPPTAAAACSVWEADTRPRIRGTSAATPGAV